MRFLSPLLALFLTPLLIGQSLGIDVHLVDSSPSSANGITVAVVDQDARPVANAAVVFRLPAGSSQPTFADGSSSTVAYTDPSGRAHVEGIHWANGGGPVSVKITAVKGTAHAGLLSELTPPARPAPAVEPSRRVAAEREHAPMPAQLRPVPGTLPAAVVDDDSPDANVPLRNTLGTGAAEGLAPSVSITSTGRSGASHSKTKWIIVGLAVAAGAGAAFALAHKGSSSSSSSSGVSIGAPTVSVGHP